jgi:hypothetical protein
MGDERRPLKERTIEPLDTIALQRRLAMTPRAPNGRPQEYDEAGFPIPQRLPTFAERVRRLLTG